MRKLQGFLYVDDVMKLFKYESNKAAYNVIRNLNDELLAKGYLVREGAVSESYLRERYHMEVAK